MHPEEILRENLPLVQRTAERVCHRAGLPREDAEDLASELTITLIENDYAVLRAWEKRSSLATYLAVIAQRLYANRRIAEAGRWHASAEARRGGDAAVLLETLVRRQGRSLDEALPIVREVDPSMTRERAEEVLARLPARAPRPRAVVIDAAEEMASTATADERAILDETVRIADRAGAVIRDLMSRLPDEDRAVIQLRYGSNVGIADIARMLRVPQRPLYRRVEALLRRFGEAFQAAGIDPRSLEDLIGSDAAELDFGLAGKETPARQTTDREVRR